jgi:error-prone DNA polymerase
MYVELHTSSAFSFLEAASLPETLVDQAARFGYPAIALLDRDGVYGAPRFHRAATAAGIKAIIGAELTIAPALEHAPHRFHLRADFADRYGGQVGAAGSAVAQSVPHSSHPSHLSHPSHPSHPSHLLRLPVLVESAEGYRNLCQLVTRMKMRAPKGEGALVLDELDGHTRGLIALASRDLLAFE